MITISKSNLLPVLQNSKLADQFEDKMTIPKKYVYVDYDVKYNIAIEDEYQFQFIKEQIGSKRKFPFELKLPKKYKLTKCEFKNKFKLSNDEDFKKVMEVLRYYMVKEIPFQVYDYIYYNKPDIENYVDFYYEDLKILKESSLELWRNLCTTTTKVESHINLVESVTEQAKLGLLKYLISKKFISKNNDEIMDAIILGSWNYYYSDRKTLNYYKKPPSLNDNHEEHNERFNCLKFLFDNNFKYSKNIIIYASIANKPDFIKFLFNKKIDCNKSNVTYYAVKYQNLELVKYLHKNGFPFGLDREVITWGCPSIEFVESQGNTLCLAASLGNVEIFKFLLENGCSTPIWRSMYFYGINSGNIKIIEYLHEKGFEINKNIINYAKKLNKNDIVEYLSNIK